MLDLEQYIRDAMKSAVTDFKIEIWQMLADAPRPLMTREEAAACVCRAAPKENG